MLRFTGRFLTGLAPLSMVYFYGEVKGFVSDQCNRQIYRLLPHPDGGGMFAGIESAAHDTTINHAAGTAPTAPQETENFESANDAIATETVPRSDANRDASQSSNRRASSDAESDDAQDHQGRDRAGETIFSFEYEVTDTLISSNTPYSATLRPQQSAKSKNDDPDLLFRVTGLTMMPTILAFEMSREVVAGLICLPLETLMVRSLATAYRHSAGLGTKDLFPALPLKNLWLSKAVLSKVLIILGMQFVVSGVIWAAYTTVTEHIQQQLLSSATDVTEEEDV